MTRPIFREAQFRKALRSDGTPPNCVHCARGMGWVVIRDTKATFGAEDDHQFGFRATDFDAFQAAIRAADVRSADIPAGLLDGLCITIEQVAADVNVVRSNVEQPGVPADAVLTFTDGEIAAFLDGVHNHEFDNDGQYTAHNAACSEQCEDRTHVALVAA